MICGIQLALMVGSERNGSPVKGNARYANAHDFAVVLRSEPDYQRDGDTAEHTTNGGAAEYYPLVLPHDPCLTPAQEASRRKLQTVLDTLK